MRSIDENAIKAKNDRAYLNDFIKEYQDFILHAASRAAGKYVTKNDDLWSISLLAFHEAVQSYSFDKGSFLPFARMVVTRRIYDSLKKEAKRRDDISVESLCEENTGAEIQAPPASDEDARLEISAIGNVLNGYGFSLFDLASASPKAGKTKEASARAIVSLLNSPILFHEMQRTGMLPIKILENKEGIPRKILERHRKYIIAGAEILSGDYPILAEYFRFVRNKL